MGYLKKIGLDDRGIKEFRFGNLGYKWRKEGVDGLGERIVVSGLEVFLRLKISFGRYSWRRKLDREEVVVRISDFWRWSSLGGW